MFDSGDHDFAIQRPVLLWLGPPLVGMQTDIAETFDICMMTRLSAALEMAGTRPPAGLVCFLDECDDPADLVHRRLNLVLHENRLIYVWPRGVEGWARFLTRTKSTVLPGSFHETELVRAARALVDPSFSLFSASRGSV